MFRLFDGGSGAGGANMTQVHNDSLWTPSHKQFEQGDWWLLGESVNFGIPGVCL